MNIIEKIKEQGVIPVIVIEDINSVRPLAEALLEGGLNVVEITFRTREAAGAIEIMRNVFRQMIVGAGTVLNIEQAEQAVDSGAQFIVSPGSNSNVIKYCHDNNICIIPGVMTPSEIEKNLEEGIETMKFFPAQAAGGPEMIKSLSAPYLNIQFMPTGGINQNNIRDYLSIGSVIACGGSWMADKDLISQQKYEIITQLSKQAVDIVRDVRKV